MPSPTPRIMAEIARNATVEAGSDKWMVFRDGEDHARLRRLLSQVFTPNAIAAWRHRTEAIVDQLLASAAEDDEAFDVITQFARPLPAQIISEMLGVPDDDIPQAARVGRTRWSGRSRRFNTPEQEQAVLEAIRAMAAYLEWLLAEKRAHPGDDILTALLAAGDSEGHLSDDEIVAQVVMLYFAGHETTENLIGNGLVHLFAHPEQLGRLRADPTLGRHRHRGAAAIRRTHPVHPPHRR